MRPNAAVRNCLVGASLAGGVLLCVQLAQAADQGARQPGDPSAGSGNTTISPPQSNERGLTPEEMRRAKPMPLPAAKFPPPQPEQHGPVAPGAPGNMPGVSGPAPK